MNTSSQTAPTSAPHRSATTADSGTLEAMMEGILGENSMLLRTRISTRGARIGVMSVGLEMMVGCRRMDRDSSR
jgi:hypothetical protein